MEESEDVSGNNRSKRFTSHIVNMEVDKVAGWFGSIFAFTSHIVNMEGYMRRDSYKTIVRLYIPHS